MKTHNLLICIIGVFLILPATGLNPYYLSILTTNFILVLFTLSWDLLGGVCGQISLGHALFFGTGSYVFALLSTAFPLPIPLTLCMALILSLALALFSGIFAIRLKGGFFALFTLALAEAAHEVSMNFPISWGKNLSMGGGGGIPFLSGAGILEKSALTWEYYITFFLVLSTIYGLKLFLATSWGLKMKSVSANELLSASCGVRTERIKLGAYAISALIAALCGILSVIHMGRATPHDFSLELSFQAATLAAVGGRGSVTGPAIAAFSLTTLFSLLEISSPVRMALYAIILPFMFLRIPRTLFHAFKE